MRTNSKRLALAVFLFTALAALAFAAEAPPPPAVDPEVLRLREAAWRAWSCCRT